MTTITIRRMLDAGLTLHGTPIDIVLDRPQGVEGDRIGSVYEEDLPCVPDWILDAPLILIDARDHGRLRLAIDPAGHNRKENDRR
ncbi:hypothetical protein Uis1B_2214 [Bifidobacterium margollesii]|uniref:Uncharacterized protein n=1 Tax=Bifidobacterium margollesii TaxID=2020964 RepID=A0A2N5J6W7_9BIFI|nr:hypothetical protein [Bifidobacterium margollesii]PLS29946.1 hypothetical protein Uis1B_2214 [Bifidobacterium margollesii]